MSPIRFAALLLLVVAVGCSGKSNDSEHAAPNVPPTAARSTRTLIESLPEVDVSALGANDKRRFFALANELLSPCGEPVSVAQCIAEHRPCRKCVPAGRYLARLAGEGYEDTQIREYFAARYAPNQDVEIDLTGAPILGSPMAQVTIVEFSDYQCPHCRLARPVLADLVREYDGRVRLVHKFFPLSSHPLAANAALAAAAAQAQGKFWEFHDLLFENQDALEVRNLFEYAERVGLDRDRFQRDLTSNQELRARVQSDADTGRRLEIHGTPSIFIDGRRYEEPIELPSLRAYVEEELQR